MRALASLCVVTLLAATAPRAFAGKCYVDSDCPTGMVCNDSGGCEVPSGSSGGTSGGGQRSSAKVILYGVIVAAVIIAILVPAMQATEDAQTLPRRDFVPPLCPTEQPAPIAGFTFAF